MEESDTFCLLVRFQDLKCFGWHPRVGGHTTVTGRVTGQSRSAPEGVWVQGGGVEISGNYEVSIHKELKKLWKQKYLKR